MKLLKFSSWSLFSLSFVGWLVIPSIVSALTYNQLDPYSYFFGNAVATVVSMVGMALCLVGYARKLNHDHRERATYIWLVLAAFVCAVCMDGMKAKPVDLLGTDLVWVVWLFPFIVFPSIGYVLLWRKDRKNKPWIGMVGALIALLYSFVYIATVDPNVLVVKYVTTQPNVKSFTISSTSWFHTCCDLKESTDQIHANRAEYMLDVVTQDGSHAKEEVDLIDGRDEMERLDAQDLGLVYAQQWKVSSVSSFGAIPTAR
jgi:ABC-type Co2+ transport system permease subunit